MIPYIIFTTISNWFKKPLLPTGSEKDITIKFLEWYVSRSYHFAFCGSYLSFTTDVYANLKKELPTLFRYLKNNRTRFNSNYFFNKDTERIEIANKYLNLLKND